MQKDAGNSLSATSGKNARPNPRPTLPKSGILRGNGSFQRIFEKGQKIEGKFLRCLYIAAPRPASSGKANVVFGAAVTRSIKRAVDRNRIKRLIRESYRLHKNNLLSHAGKSGISMEIIFGYFPRRTGTAPDLPSFSEVEKDMEYLLSALIVRGGG